MKDGKMDNFYLRTFIIIISTTFLTLYGVYFLPIVLILFPLLFIVNSIEDGLSDGITSMVVTIIIISIVSSKTVGLGLAIIFIPFTIIISTLIKKRQSNIKILGYSSIAFFVSILIMMFLIEALGTDIAKVIENMTKQAMDVQFEILEDIDLSNYDFFNIKQQIQDVYRYLLLIIPSLILILSSLVSYINYLLSAIILDKVGIKIVNIPKFSKFTLPNNIIPGVIAMFLITFLSGKLGFSYYKTVFLNISVLLMIGFLIQGLSVANHLLNKLKLNVIFKIIFYVTFILNQTLVSIITIVGLTDLIFDFRKLRVRKRLK